MRGADSLQQFQGTVMHCPSEALEGWASLVPDANVILDEFISDLVPSSYSAGYIRHCDTKYWGC